MRFGGAVAGFDAEKYLSAKELRKMDPFMHYGYAAAADALKDSGIDGDAGERRSASALRWARASAACDTIEENYDKYIETNSPKKISPFFVPGSIINMISGHVSIQVQTHRSEHRDRHCVHDLDARDRPRACA